MAGSPAPVVGLDPPTLVISLRIGLPLSLSSSSESKNTISSSEEVSELSSAIIEKGEPCSSSSFLSGLTGVPEILLTHKQGVPRVKLNRYK